MAERDEYRKLWGDTRPLRPAADPIGPLLAELAAAVFSHAAISKRMRIAVTPVEYQRIRCHLLKGEGSFAGRIRNIPLVIEERPLDPMLAVELAGTPPQLTPSQLRLLCWLARENISQYGECYGPTLDALQRLGLVRTTTEPHDPDNPDAGPDAGWPPPSKFHGVNLTQAARDFIRDQGIDVWKMGPP